MKKLLLTVLIIIIHCVCHAQFLNEKFVYPAEFEKVDAIWMTWSFDPNDDNDTSVQVLVDMARAITSQAELHLFVHDDTVKRQALESMLRLGGVDTSKVKFYYSYVYNRYVRDFGPIFLKGNHGHLKGIDYNWNCYGGCIANTEDARYFGKIDSLMEAKMGLDIEKTMVCGEGGDRDFNGKGTMMVVESVELNRNPTMSRDQLEQEFKKIFRVKKVIWLKKGLSNDDHIRDGIHPCDLWATGTGGHIDDFCRFADAHTIILAEQQGKSICDSITRIDRDRMEENFRILRSSTDQDGKPFVILRMPVADVHVNPKLITAMDTAYFRGTHIGDTVRRLSGNTYLNFVPVNKLVLVPRNYKAGGPESTRLKDEQAVAVFKKAFPGREIVQIDVSQFVKHDGGMHCATQNQPSVN